MAPHLAAALRAAPGLGRGEVAGAVEGRARRGARLGGRRGALAGFPFAGGPWLLGGREAALDAGVIDVAQPVGILGDESGAGEDEDVAPVGGGVQQLAVRARAPRGDQAETAARSGLIQFPADPFQALGAARGRLPLIHVGEAVGVAGHEALEAFEEQTMPVGRERPARVHRGRPAGDLGGGGDVAAVGQPALGGGAGGVAGDAAQLVRRGVVEVDLAVGFPALGVGVVIARHRLGQGGV